MDGRIHKRRGKQLSDGRRWTQVEIQKLHQLAHHLPPKLIARTLERSHESVRQKASREGIRFLEYRANNITG